MNNFRTNRGKDFSYHSKNIMPFEEDYEKIKTKPQEVFMKYYKQIVGTMHTVAYYQNFDREELIQDSYEIFLDLCKKYDPYYQGNFVQFDKYLFSNLILQQRANIQKHYKNSNREITSDDLSGATHNILTPNDDCIKDAQNKIYVRNLYKYLTPIQYKVIKMYYEGAKQREIGETIGINQTKVSSILIHCIEMLKELTKDDRNKLLSATQTYD